MKKIQSFLFLIYLLIIFQAHAQDTVILHHTWYTTIYVHHLKAPILSHYYFTAMNRAAHAAKRSAFHDDPQLPADQQASARDYKGDKYDKGHLSPDDDFRFSASAESDAMEYTNQAPQAPKFNRITWRELENHVRQLGKKYDTMSVYTGCIYHSPKFLSGDVAIPFEYYKIIFYEDASEAYLGLNMNQEGTYIGTKSTISLIEKLTGFKYQKRVVKYLKEKEWNKVIW